MPYGDKTSNYSLIRQTREACDRTCDPWFTKASDITTASGRLLISLVVLDIQDKVIKIMSCHSIAKMILFQGMPIRELFYGTKCRFFCCVLKALLLNK